MVRRKSLAKRVSAAGDDDDASPSRLRTRDAARGVAARTRRSLQWPEDDVLGGGFEFRLPTAMKGGGAGRGGGKRPYLRAGQHASRLQYRIYTKEILVPARPHGALVKKADIRWKYWLKIEGHALKHHSVRHGRARVPSCVDCPWR